MYLMIREEKGQPASRGTGYISTARQQKNYPWPSFPSKY